MSGDQPRGQHTSHGVNSDLREERGEITPERLRQSFDLETAGSTDTASAALESLHQRAQQHPECVGDSVQDREAEEAGSQHHPGPGRLRGGDRGYRGDEGGSPGGGGARISVSRNAERGQGGDRVFLPPGATPAETQPEEWTFSLL